jgi:hypothetical protein
MEIDKNGKCKGDGRAKLRKTELKEMINDNVGKRGGGRGIRAMRGNESTTVYTY